MKRIKNEDIVKLANLFKKYGFKNITCILLSLILVYSLHSNITKSNSKLTNIKTSLISSNIDNLEEMIEYTESKSDKVLELFIDTSDREETNDFVSSSKEITINKVAFLEASLRNKDFYSDNITGELAINSIEYSFDSTEMENSSEEQVSKSNVDEQIEYILERYDLTMFEFTSIVYVVFHEVYPNNYDDAYRVINLIYNRTLSKSCVDYVSYLTGIDGRSMYAQVIAPGQFIVYNPNKVYFNMEEKYNTVTFQAILDFLTTEERIHDYLSYKATGSKINDGVQFTSNGNVYHNLLQEDDLIDNEVKLVRNR